MKKLTYCMLASAVLLNGCNTQEVMDYGFDDKTLGLHPNAPQPAQSKNKTAFERTNTYFERDVKTRPNWSPEARRTSATELLTFQAGHAHINKEYPERLRALIARVDQGGPIYARIVARGLDARDAKTMNPARAQRLRDMLVGLGIPRANIELIDHAKSEMASGKWPVDQVMVAIDRYAVVGPKCEGWTQKMDGQVSPEGEEAFGCVSESNFAKMIADPRDLYSGRPLEGGDGVHRVLSIEKYRSDKVKEVKIEKVKTDGA